MASRDLLRMLAAVSRSIVLAAPTHGSYYQDKIYQSRLCRHRWAGGWERVNCRFPGDTDYIIACRESQKALAQKAPPRARGFYYGFINPASFSPEIIRGDVKRIVVVRAFQPTLLDCFRFRVSGCHTKIELRDAEMRVLYKYSDEIIIGCFIFVSAK